jgi:hypothetical protein
MFAFGPQFFLLALTASIASAGIVKRDGFEDGQPINDAKGLGGPILGILRRAQLDLRSATNDSYRGNQ